MARDHPNVRQGAFAEKYAANSYGLEHVPNETEWYDCVDESTGTRYEVKSTTREYSGEYSEGATGRFRVWEDQHRSLTNAEGAETHTAWYVFIVLDEDGEVEHIVRRKPSTVTKIVDGEWNRANHAERNSRQHKIPWYQAVHR